MIDAVSLSSSTQTDGRRRHEPAPPSPSASFRASFLALARLSRGASLPLQQRRQKNLQSGRGAVTVASSVASWHGLLRRRRTLVLHFLDPLPCAQAPRRLDLGEAWARHVQRSHRPLQLHVLRHPLDCIGGRPQASCTHPTRATHPQHTANRHNTRGAGVRPGPIVAQYKLPVGCGRCVQTVAKIVRSREAAV